MPEVMISPRGIEVIVAALCEYIDGYGYTVTGKEIRTPELEVARRELEKLTDIHETFLDNRERGRAGVKEISVIRR